MSADFKNKTRNYEWQLANGNWPSLLGGCSPAEACFRFLATTSTTIPPFQRIPENGEMVNKWQMGN
jgi:hypothetical protein